MLQTNINPRGGRPRAVPRKTMDTLMQEHTAPDAEAVEIAFQAVRLFAETHPARCMSHSPKRPKCWI